jgi:uncharacterized protein YjbI with pentapeptide repeats
MRVRVVEWTMLHAVWLRAQYPSFAGWLQYKGLIPIANLRGANLRGANLYGADLCGANLRATYRGDSPAPDGWRKTASGYLERAA